MIKNILRDISPGWTAQIWNNEYLQWISNRQSSELNVLRNNTMNNEYIRENNDPDMNNSSTEKKDKIW